MSIKSGNEGLGHQNDHHRHKAPEMHAAVINLKPRKGSVLLAFALATLLTGCSPVAQRQVEEVKARSDPSSLTLERGYNDYVRRVILDDGTEAGIITCRDGSTSKFWFRSHHLTGDEGGTLFQLSDETEFFMLGWFCCEVQLPDQQLASLKELKTFIHEHDGISP